MHVKIDLKEAVHGVLFKHLTKPGLYQNEDDSDVLILVLEDGTKLFLCDDMEYLTKADNSWNNDRFVPAKGTITLEF